MRPMSKFDPSAPAMVHDRLNDRTFEWKPEWRAAYEKHAARHAPGVIEFDGLLLDGWTPSRLEQPAQLAPVSVPGFFFASQ